jgi:hypothetical protein
MLCYSDAHDESGSGIVARFNFRSTSLCFVGTHLPAHEGEAYRKDRNRTVAKIQEKCRVGNEMLDLSSQFDHVFWCGDLNYRVDLPLFDSKPRTHEEKVNEVKGFLREQDWQGLYQRDELQAEQAAGRVFAGWQQARPDFPPTFKIKQHEPVMYNVKRVPSYCDRVLWRSMPGVSDCLALKEFNSAVQLHTSDHQPIYAKFSLSVPKPAQQRQAERTKLLLAHGAEWQREVHGRWRTYSERVSKAIEESFAAWLSGKQQDHEFAVGITDCPGAPSPLASPDPTHTMLRTQLRSLQQQTDLQHRAMPTEGTSSKGLAITVDFKEMIVTDELLGSSWRHCRIRCCRKTRRRLRRLEPRSTTHVVLRFQQLSAVNLQAAQGPRLHGIADGFTALVAGSSEIWKHQHRKRQHQHAVAKLDAENSNLSMQSGTSSQNVNSASTTSLEREGQPEADIQHTAGGSSQDECSPYVEVFSEELFRTKKRIDRTDVDTINGCNPVWEAHETPPLHTKVCTTVILLPSVVLTVCTQGLQ